MPLNEVLAMYGYESGVEYDDTNQEVPEHDSDSSPVDSPQQMMENPDSPRIITSQMMQSQSDSSPIDEPSKVGVMDLVFYDAPDVPMGSSRPLLRCNYNFCYEIIVFYSFHIYKKISTGFLHELSLDFFF